MNRAGWSFTAVLSLSSILAGLQTGCVQQKFSRSDSFKDSLSAEQIAALQKRQAPANKLRKSFNLKMEQGHLVDAGKDLDALEAYLRVIQMDGIHSEAKLLRAIWYVESGDNSAALKPR